MRGTTNGDLKSKCPDQTVEDKLSELKERARRDSVDNKTNTRRHQPHGPGVEDQVRDLELSPPALVALIALE